MARILIVEDELVAAWSIQESLENAGHTVVSNTPSGVEAVEIAAATRPDLVIMDILLQGQVDGITAATQIREQFGIPVIYLTAHTDEQTLQRVIATEPFGYLVKPFNTVELYTTINIALRRHQLEKQLQHTEQWLSTTLESIGDGTIATDREGYITFMNPAAENLTGWQQAEVLGVAADQVLNLVHAETGEVIDNPLLRAIAVGSQVSLPDHCLLRTKEGTERAVGDTAAPIRDRGGEITGSVLVFQDISKRKQAEELLHRREQEFRALVENSPDIIARLDPQLCYVYVNPAMERTTGIPAQAFVGRTNQALGMPQSLIDAWDNAVREVFATGQEQTIEFDLFTVDGAKSYQARLVPEFAQDNTVVSVLSVARDITQHKQMETVLRQQAEREQLLRTIAQQIRQSLNLDEILNITVTEVRQLLQTDRVVFVQFESNRDGIIAAESVGAGWQSILGITVSRIQLQQLMVAYQERDLQSIPDVQRASYLPVQILEQINQYQIRSLLTVPILQDEQLLGILSMHQCSAPRDWQAFEVALLEQIATQVTIAIQQSELYQQVQLLNADLEEQIQERTAQLQQAFNFEATLKRITDRVRDSLDEAHILQTAIEELARAIGVSTCNAALYNLEQQTSTICYEFTMAVSPFHSQTLHMANFPEGYRQLLQGKYFQFCALVPHPDQGRVAKLACPMSDDQGILGDLWLIHDSDYAFTEPDVRLVQLVANQCAIALRQARLFNTAQAQVEELERLNQLKDDFLSTTSHELRTPMSNIKMATEMLEITLNRLGVLDSSTESLTRYLQILKDEGNRESKLIDDLLKFSQLEAGTETPVITPIDLQSWVPQVLEEFIDRIHNQQQQLEIDLPANLPPLTTDRSYLEKILIELLNNACKYTPAQETIRIAACVTERHLELRVSNSGIEIPVSEFDRIFDKFYRIPNRDPWQHSGTGLGLALVKKLVDQLGAMIRVESAARQTIFIVSFPL